MSSLNLRPNLSQMSLQDRYSYLSKSSKQHGSILLTYMHNLATGKLKHMQTINPVTALLCFIMLNDEIIYTFVTKTAKKNHGPTDITFTNHLDDLPQAYIRQLHRNNCQQLRDCKITIASKTLFQPWPRNPYKVWQEDDLRERIKRQDLNNQYANENFTDWVSQFPNRIYY